MATTNTTRDSYISSDLARSLKLKKRDIREKDKVPDFGDKSEIQGRVKIDIKLSDGRKLEEVPLYVLSGKHFETNAVILGTDVFSTVYPGNEAAPTHSGGIMTSLNSSGAPVNQAASATYSASQQGCTSAWSADSSSTYTQNLSAATGSPYSSYAASSYPNEVRTTSSSHYQPSHQSHGYYQTPATTTSTHYDSNDRSGMAGSTNPDQAGTDDNFRSDGDYYSLHSDSLNTHTTIVTPRPLGDDNQDVYSSATDNKLYAGRITP